MPGSRFTRGDFQELDTRYARARFLTRSLSDFGAIGDGITNNTDAFQAAAAWLTANSGGTLLIPPGVYMVGRQDPVTYVGETVMDIVGCTYPVRLIGDSATIKMVPGLRVGDPGPLPTRQAATAYSVGNTVGPRVRNGRLYTCTTAGTTHATIAPAFPLTIGATVTDGTVIWTCTSLLTRASPGIQIKFTNPTGSISVSGLDLDGSLDELVYDSGSIEVESEGLFFSACTGGVVVENVNTHHHARDGIYFTSGPYYREVYETWTASTIYPAGQVITGTALPGASEQGAHYRIATTVGGTSHTAEPTWPTTVGGTVTESTGVTWTHVGTNLASMPLTLLNVRSEFNGRQGFSHVGGIGVYARNCDFSQTGRASLWTAPGAGVDIEPNTSVTRQVHFVNCRMVNNIGTAFTCAGYRFPDGVQRSGNILLENCTLWATSGYALYCTTPDVHLNKCKIFGSIGATFGDYVPVWKARVTWDTDTAYTVGMRVTPTVSNGRSYECDVAGRTSTDPLTEPTWPLDTDAEVGDSDGIIWRCVGAAPAIPVGTVRKPTTDNGSRYMAVVAGSGGAVEPAVWGTAPGDLVVDNEVTWRNIGIDYLPETRTTFTKCLIENRRYGAWGVKEVYALIRSNRGGGYVLDDCTIRLNPAVSHIYAIYASGETDARRATIRNCKVYHNDLSPPSSQASFLNWVDISNTIFYESAAMPSGKYILANNTAVGPGVIVTGPNVHWRTATTGPIGVITQTTGTSAVGVIAASTTLVTVVNTVTETEIYSTTIAGGTITGANKIRLELQGYYLNNSGANRQYTLRVKIGVGTMTVVFSDTSAAQVTNASRHDCRAEVEIMPLNGSSTAQYARGRMEWGPTQGFAGIASATAPIVRSGPVDSLAKTAASDLTLQVTVEMTAADANLSFTKVAAHLILVSA